MSFALPPVGDCLDCEARRIKAVSYADIAVIVIEAVNAARTFALGGSRHKLSMIASVTNQGKTSWRVTDPENHLNADPKQSMGKQVPVREPRPS